MGGFNHEVMKQIMILKIYLLGIEDYITTTTEQIGRLPHVIYRPRYMRGSKKIFIKILSFIYQ